MPIFLPHAPLPIEQLPDLEQLAQIPRVVRTLRTLRRTSRIRRPDRIIMGEEAFDEYCDYVDGHSDRPLDGIYFCGSPVLLDENLLPHEIQWGTPPKLEARPMTTEQAIASQKAITANLIAITGMSQRAMGQMVIQAATREQERAMAAFSAKMFPMPNQMFVPIDNPFDFRRS